MHAVFHNFHLSQVKVHLMMTYIWSSFVFRYLDVLRRSVKFKSPRNRTGFAFVTCTGLPALPSRSWSIITRHFNR